MRNILYLSLTTLFTFSLYAQPTMFEIPLSPRNANYNIDGKLDTEQKKLYGKEVITWRNKSGDYIPDLQFHLYLNAFKNEQSTFMKESGGYHRQSRIHRNRGWGWTQIKSMKIGADTDITDSIRFIQPDDGNTNDETVIQVLLPEAVKPHETIEVLIEWEAQLPRVFARTGYKGDFFMVGQWFPKIGVYEAAGDRYAITGQWNCHQFHSNSEFFADFGVYDVKITLPEKYIVGATGIQIGEEKHEDGNQTLRFYCEDVHDFAWTADTDYILVEDQWQDVKIKYLVQPFREYAAERIIEAAKVTFEYLDEWFGPYPYPILTIVDPQYGASGAGGMEYPTFITAGTYRYLLNVAAVIYRLDPKAHVAMEEVTVHELGHNYFYGIIANNEFEEAWLDEGVNTYAELKIMDTYYGQNGGSNVDLFGLKIMNSQSCWHFYSKYPKRDKIYKNSWEYERGGYGLLSYNKPALMLFTLENYIGLEKMKKFTREYYSKFKYKHPTTVDFINTFNDVTGDDYNWFFDQALYGTKVLDYSIKRIINTPIKTSLRGIFGDPGARDDSLTSDVNDDTPKHADSLTAGFESEVWVSREGDFLFPVEILVKFSNGEEILETWDGRDQYKILRYESPSRVISAEVDPQHKIWLDVSFLNNGKTVQKYTAPKLRYNFRWLFWAQNILQFLAIFS